MSNEVWKVLINNQVYETDLDTLKQWIMQGRVMHEDKIQKGALSWTAAKNVPALRDALSNLPAPPAFNQPYNNPTQAQQPLNQPYDPSQAQQPYNQQYNQYNQYTPNPPQQPFNPAQPPNYQPFNPAQPSPQPYQTYNPAQPTPQPGYQTYNPALQSSGYQKSSYPVASSPYNVDPNQILVNAPGFEGRQLIVQKPGLFSGAKLFIDGQPAPSAEKRGQYLLQRNDGMQVIARFKNVFLDPLPQLIINEQPVPMVEPLQSFEKLIVGLPFILIFFGGLLGGLFGGIGSVANGYIFRSKLDITVKYLAAIGVLGLTFGTYFVIALIFAILLNRPR